MTEHPTDPSEPTSFDDSNDDSFGDSFDDPFVADLVRRLDRTAATVRRDGPTLTAVRRGHRTAMHRARRRRVAVVGAAAAGLLAGTAAAVHGTGDRDRRQVAAGEGSPSTPPSTGDCPTQATVPLVGVPAVYRSTVVALSADQLAALDGAGLLTDDERAGTGPHIVLDLERVRAIDAAALLTAAQLSELLLADDGSDDDGVASADALGDYLAERYGDVAEQRLQAVLVLSSDQVAALQAGPDPLLGPTVVEGPMALTAAQLQRLDDRHLLTDDQVRSILDESGVTVAVGGPGGMAVTERRLLSVLLYVGQLDGPPASSEADGVPCPPLATATTARPDAGTEPGDTEMTTLDRRFVAQIVIAKSEIVARVAPEPDPGDASVPGIVAVRPGWARPGTLDHHAVVVGPRATAGAAFTHLDRLVVGDRIVVEVDGVARPYVVDRAPHEVPGEAGVDEFLRSFPEATRLTLVTYAPRYSATARLVVSAVPAP